MRFFAFCCVFLAASLLSTTRCVSAHPMGNFSINHYARFQARANVLELRYILDFAEIPSAERMAQLDANNDERVSESEKSAFLKSEAQVLLAGLTLKSNGRPLAPQVKASRLELQAGAGGLQTLRVILDLSAPLSSGAHRVSYQDNNFSSRTGWMEVLAFAGEGRTLQNSTAATLDRSRGLTAFPLESGAVPPRQSSATFTITAFGAPANASASANANTAPDKTVGVAAGEQASRNDATPQNGFTQSIAARELTPGLVLAGVLLAMGFGAVHALSPGHGKTMVAAYLVGTRGTPRHAMLLGLVVTITHTFGVFALGLVTLFATRYIVPERIFPVLSAVSGLLIFGVGLWLLMSRWQLLTASRSSHAHDHHTHNHDHNHDHSHSHEHAREHDHAYAHEHGLAHSHDHDHVHHEGEHEHEHSHDHDHTHSHDAHSHNHEHSHEHGAHVHSHGGRAHSHAVPDGPVTLHTLVALGISGGIVPCPEALVVLLAAVKLHRIGYGLLLITAFSIGLAAALILIGLAVVSARQRMSGLERFADGALSRYLPVASAALITVIGFVLTLRVLLTGTP